MDTEETKMGEFTEAKKASFKMPTDKYKMKQVTAPAKKQQTNKNLQSNSKMSMLNKNTPNFLTLPSMQSSQTEYPQIPC